MKALYFFVLFAIASSMKMSDGRKQDCRCKIIPKLYKNGKLVEVGDPLDYYQMSGPGFVKLNFNLYKRGEVKADSIVYVIVN